MQIIELLRENLDVFFMAVQQDPDSALIEEAGHLSDDHYYAVYELNDEVFLFHFAKKILSQLIVFENVPAALEYLRSAAKP